MLQREAIAFMSGLNSSAVRITFILSAVMGQDLEHGKKLTIDQELRPSIGASGSSNFGRHRSGLLFHLMKNSMKAVGGFVDRLSVGDCLRLVMDNGEKDVAKDGTNRDQDGRSFLC